MFRAFPPHPSLGHLVRSYGALDDVHTELTAEHRLYPECTVLLRFLHGESYLGVGNDLKRLPPMYVQEFRDFPVRLRSCGRTRMVGVAFYPWGAIRLLGPSTSHALNPCTIPAQVSPLFAARMQRLLAADQQDEALRVLEEWLLARAARVDLEPTAAVLVATRLVETGGLGTVTELADGVGLSVRQLERQFRAQVGMTPKSLARLTRFEAARRRIYEGGALSFTRLAHDLGYADQAHFTREFRAFAEQSPGTVVAEVKEFLRRQGDVAFVQAERAVAF
ncbi:MAG: helix-turn-helix domain-containing protein [Polyangiaceae bacterium]